MLRKHECMINNSGYRRRWPHCMNKGTHSVYLSMVFLYVTMGYVQMIMLNKQQTFRLRIDANDTE